MPVVQTLMDASSKMYLISLSAACHFLCVFVVTEAVGGVPPPGAPLMIPAAATAATAGTHGIQPPPGTYRTQAAPPTGPQPPQYSAVAPMPLNAAGSKFFCLLSMVTDDILMTVAICMIVSPRLLLELNVECLDYSTRIMSTTHSSRYQHLVLICTKAM